jgi:hypothetical protein
MRRSSLLAMIAVAAAACSGIDKLLEGGDVPNGRVSLSLQPTTISVPLDGEVTLTLTVSRSGEFRGAVALSLQNAPAGISAAFGPPTTTGQVSTVAVTVTVAPGASLGSHSITIRGDASPLPHAIALLQLTVTQPPFYALAVSDSTPTILRGGTVPLVLRAARTAFTGGVILSLDGVAGITAAFGANPLHGDSTSMTVSVNGGVAPGNYIVALRGSAVGLADRSVPMTVTVTGDPIQLLMSPDVAASQGSSVQALIQINRAGYDGPVTLSAENLPAGVTAGFQPAAPTGTSATMTLTVAGMTAPGPHTVTLRGTGISGPHAMTTFVLRVAAAGITLALAPTALTLQPGGTSTSTATVTRTAYPGAVTFSAENVPPGLTVTPSPATTTGPGTTLTAMASGAAVPGQYDVIVRATPDALGAGASRTATLRVSVVSSSTGNVALDWSGCTAPDWVAGQDGAGPWTQVLPAGGLARFSVTSGRGGFAFALNGAVTVRYLTQEELTAQTLAMCPPPVPTKRVFGTGAHAAAGETWHYRFGGASATSTGQFPSFTLHGVADGVHDLLAWGQSFLLTGQQRGFIRRDVDVADNGTLDPVDLAGLESFQGFSASLTVTGGAGQEPGGTFSSSMSYLTSAACRINPLHDLGLVGVPEARQRPNDFHMLTVRWRTAASNHVAHEVFRKIAPRTVALAAPTPAIAVAVLPGAYRRLSAALGQVVILYDDAATLHYESALRSMRVSASRGYAGSGNITLAMPDFSGVGGWLDAYGLPAGASGTWTVTLDGGGAHEPLCVENRRVIQATRVGTF